MGRIGSTGSTILLLTREHGGTSEEQSFSSRRGKVQAYARRQRYDKSLPRVRIRRASQSGGNSGAHRRHAAGTANLGEMLSSGIRENVYTSRREAERRRTC